MAGCARLAAGLDRHAGAVFTAARGLLFAADERCFGSCTQAGGILRFSAEPRAVATGSWHSCSKQKEYCDYKLTLGSGRYRSRFCKCTSPMFIISRLEV